MTQRWPDDNRVTGDGIRGLPGGLTRTPVRGQRLLVLSYDSITTYSVIELLSRSFPRKSRAGSAPMIIHLPATGSTR